MSASIVDSLMVRAEDGATVEVVECADGSRVLIVERARDDCPEVVDCVEVRLDADRAAFLATALQRGGRA